VYLYSSSSSEGILSGPNDRPTINYFLQKSEKLPSFIPHNWSLHRGQNPVSYVYVAFSVSVPIIPEFLYEIRHPNESMAALTTASTTTTTETTPAASQPCNNPSGNISEPASTVFDTSEYFRISLQTSATCCTHAPADANIIC
jgi:hypothetical protein